MMFLIRFQFSVIIFLAMWTLSATVEVFAEGTKELRPAERDKGNLLLLPDYTMFGLYGASPQEQLKIRITSLDETIYFGLNNKNGTDARGNQNDQGVFVPNVPYRIVSPSGAVVYTSVIPDIGEPGNIPNWEEAVTGPRQLGNPAGYDAIVLKPLEVGDYVIEFDPGAVRVVRLNIPLFDITVTDVNNRPITARLHSQGWQISTESYNNPFNGKVYPYDSTAVYEVDFNGIQPFVFTINFNSKGTEDTGDFIKDRKSKVGNFTYAEYEVFLNPPEEELYPTAQREIALDAEVLKRDCKTSDFCLNFTTSDPGNLQGFIDLNMNGVYDPDNNEVLFGEYVTEAGTKCIYWDGRDSRGQLVPTGSFQVSATLGFGPIHLPLYDVEHNTKGYKINVVRPAGATAPEIFWDDSDLTEGSVIDTKTNFTGCHSASLGCHRWSDRGSILDARFLERQETINTWWYSSMVTRTIEYANTLNQQVRLSFDSTLLINRDTTVCKGDSLSFYIFNDGADHFNNSKYSYEWFYNNITLPQQQRSHKVQVMDVATVVIKATDTSGACISNDTLRINVVEPVRIRSVVVEPPCDMVTGSINVEIVAGSPGSEFFWQEYPAEKTGILQDLRRGTYHLVAQDPEFPWCGVDTTFTLKELGGIEIDTVTVQSTLCTEANGQAAVFMKDPARVYEYSFNGAAFSSASTLASLRAGLHRVLAREVSTGCTDERPFQILSPPVSVSFIPGDEICGNKRGSVTIVSPFTNPTVSWVDGYKDTVARTNLSAGRYPFTISDRNNPACRADSVAIVGSSTYGIEGDFNFTALPDSGEKKLIKFNNLSDSSYASLWDFGDGSSSKLFSPAHNYWNDREYEVVLHLTDSNGCEGEVVKSFSPFRLSSEICGINLPNVFSPNNDAMNDDIGILGYAPVVELKIFNRWGELVFRTFEIPQRWDGFYRGVESPIGVYPYILEWECPVGENGKVKHRKVGDITLVR